MASEIIPYYVEINLFALSMLLIIHLNLSKKTAYFRNEILYKSAIITTMVAILSDATATLLEAKMYPGSILVNSILDAVYFLTSLAIPYIYLAYVRALANPKGKIFDWFIQLISVPYYVFLFLLITNPTYHLIFNIDEGNNYTRGPLRPLHSYIAAFILVLSFVYTLYHYRKDNLPLEIKKYLLILPLFPLFGVISRNAIQGSNLIWTSMTIGLIILYIHGQNSMIHTDSLTKLNNKGGCLEYLDMKMNKLMPSHQLYVSVFDINDFKQINDTYGHMEGDHAIVVFSQILQEVFKEHKDFIARFGGDEFVVISERKLNVTMDCEFERIKEKLQERNELGDLPYKMSVSIGTAYYTKELNISLEALINQADKNMYKQKQEFHK